MRPSLEKAMLDYDDGHEHELAVYRRWARRGAVLTALLLIWNVVVTSSIVFKPQTSVSLEPGCLHGPPLPETLHVSEEESLIMKREADLDPRNNTTKVSLSKTVSTSTSGNNEESEDVDLSDALEGAQVLNEVSRTPFQNFGSISMRGIEFAAFASGAYLAGDACMNWAKDEDADWKGSWSCIAGATSTALAIRSGYQSAQYAGTYHTLQGWYRELMETVTVHVQEDPENGAILELEAPHYHEMPDNQIHELPAHIQDFRDLVGNDIWHVGQWDAPSDVHEGLPRRDNGEAYGSVPVFGTKMLGRDGASMHFTFTGLDPSGDSGYHNHTGLRFGFGPGPATEQNVEGLRKRDSVPQTYNDQYFDKGGFEYFFEMPQADDIHEDIYPDPENEGDYEWIYDQVKCYIDTIMESDDDNEVSGFRFQMWSNYDRFSMMVGVILFIDPEDPEKSHLQELAEDQDVFQAPIDPLDECTYHLSSGLISPSEVDDDKEPDEHDEVKLL